jgi:hypothetical protein
MAQTGTQDIVVDDATSAPKSFNPSIYPPDGGKVHKGDWINFRAAGNRAIPFYVLRPVPGGFQKVLLFGGGAQPYWANASPGNPLTIDENLTHDEAFVLSLVDRSQGGGGVNDPQDGEILVGSGSGSGRGHPRK